MRSLQVILGNVEGDVGDLGVQLNGLFDRVSESKARKQEDVVAFSNSLIDHGNTLSSGVDGRLVVGEVDAAGLAQ